MQTIPVGCFFLCVLGLFLAFLRKNTAGFESCNRNEKRRELFLPSLPHLPKPFWCFPQKSKVSRLSTFGSLAADKLRMCLVHCPWVIKSSNISPCYPLSKASCFQPSPPWSNWGGKKKPGWRDECWKSWLWEKESFTQTLVALCVALFWQPGKPIAGHWQLTWGCGLRRAPPRLLCACPHHFVPDSTTADNFKLPFFTTGP